MSAAANPVRIAVTRDSVCLADDIDAPHTDAIVVPGDATLRRIARAVMRGSYLAYLSPTATWHVRVGDAAVVFGKRCFLPFVWELGDGPCARDLTALHFHYHAQRPREGVRQAVAAELARGVAKPSGRAK